VGFPWRSTERTEVAQAASARARGRLKVSSLACLMLGTSLAPLLSGVAATPAGAVSTCTHNWVGAAGGSFMVASNWDANTVPGRTSRVCSLAGSTIVFSGAVRIDSANLLGSLTISAGSSLKLQSKPSSTLSTINNLTVLGRLHNTGPVNLTGSGTLAGVLSGSKDKVVMAGSTYAFGAGISIGTKSAKGTLINRGTLNWASGTLTVCRSSTFLNQGTFNVTAAGASVVTSCNNGSAIIKNDTAGTMNVAVGATTVTVGSTLANAGAIVVSSGTLAANGYAQSGGSIDLATGASLRPTLTPAEFTGGVLTGTGSVVGGVNGAATITPGGSAIGTLSVTNAWLPTSSSSLAVTLGGTTPGLFDQMVVGSATLGGTLALTTAPGFTPVVGQSFTIITGGSITGNFTAVTGANPGPNLFYVVIPGPTSVVVWVTDQPGLAIGDVTVVEGDNGVNSAVFPVTLSSPSSEIVTVNWASANVTATAGSDYTGGSDVLTFDPGVAAETITIPINPETVIEPNETFTVTLSGSVNSAIVRPVGLGTIVDDDAVPSVFVDDTSGLEGTGVDGALTFTVRLSNPTQKIVKVPYTTADGTASSTSDYGTSAATLTFAAEQVAQTFTVTTTGDDQQENDETMLVNLGVPTNGIIVDGQATGTIQNDDNGWTITTTTDGVDAAPGNGYCATLGGACTLRAAVQEANALAGTQEIRLVTDTTYLLSIAGRDEDAAATGDLDITDTLTITGNDAIVDGGQLDRVFHVPGTTDISMSDLTVQKGRTMAVSVLQEQTAGGGMLLHMGNADLDGLTFTGNFGDAGGGLGNAYATLTLTAPLFTLNTSMHAGGGMLNFTGALTMVGGEFASNQALVTGGGFVVWGKANVMGTNVHDNMAVGFGGGVTGLSLDPTTKLDSVTINRNTSRSAGGLGNAGYLTVSNSTISDNIASVTSGGAGINAGALVISKSTISNNRAVTFGGGLENRYIMQVSTSTISGNTATTGIGSGLYAGQGSTGVFPSTTVVDSTVTANTGSSAVASDLNATTTVFNTIIGAQTSGTNCFGVVNSAGFNLVSDASCVFAGSGDVVGVAPNLGALAPNGGTTLTHLPNVGSPVIGTGFPACNGTDQRGVARPTGGACDRGAVER